MSNEVKKEISAKCRRAYYIQGVNINYSFRTLKALAEQEGAKLEEHDILVVDNERGDKRKLLKVTKNGAIILYAMLLKDIFTELPNKSTAQGALDYFTYDR